MSEETNLTEEDLKAVEGVKDRLKFFFSDANVRQDFFIRKQLMNDKGSMAHKLTIESLLRFNTIKQHTTKPAVIIKAAKELSDLLTINDEETAIGRVVLFTKEMMDGHVPKSLHLKNVPLKKKDGNEQEMQYAVTVEEIRDIFAKYGEVAMIKLKWGAHGDADGEGDDDGRKQRKKKIPTGCALVEFSTEADLEKAAEATLTTKNGESQEPKEKIVFGEAEVQVMLLSEIKTQNDNRKRKSKDDEPDDNVEVKTFTFEWQPGCVITMTGVPVDCDREALLDMVAEGMGITVEEVKDKKIYVDYSRGEKNAALRFPVHGDHIADICKKLQDGNLQIKGSKVETARILDGDDEKKYWDDFIAFKNKQIHQRADEKRSRKKQRRH
mmetsp:Transcript_22346/g.64039  ORF Transcript_22346/g.64039 Transcript_22346/m.64039 type:complete len:382 (-) Transcript_22346:23-1168(-)